MKPFVIQREMLSKERVQTVSLRGLGSCKMHVIEGKSYGNFGTGRFKAARCIGYQQSMPLVSLIWSMLRYLQYLKNP
jgi:hypothetical protein